MEKNTNIDVADLKKRVDHIEYDDLKDLKEEQGDIKLELKENSILTKQAIESNNKLSNTMDVLKETMVEMKDNLRESSRINKEVVATVEKIDNRVNNVDSKVDQNFTLLNDKINAVDNKTKIDTAEIQKDSIKDILKKYGGWGIAGTAILAEVLFRIFS